MDRVISQRLLLHLLKLRRGEPVHHRTHKLRAACAEFSRSFRPPHKRGWQEIFNCLPQNPFSVQLAFVVANLFGRIERDCEFDDVIV